MECIGNQCAGGALGPAARAVALGILFSLVLLAVARPAAARPPDTLFQDRVIEKSAPVARSASAVPRVPLPGGGSVRVQVDPEFAGGGALQRVINTLAELPHGPEMSRLSVHIADLANLFRLCGQGATACYYPDSETMIISGSPINQNNGMPQGMVIAHEYGHHIEANRTTPGWDASRLGGRYWATYEHVCEGVAAGRLFPGDEGAHYWENPGEAYAQAYATMLYPDAVPWWWSFAEPDQGAFAAIRAGISDPSLEKTVSWRSRLTPRSPAAATAVTTSLDGPITISLRQPRSGRFKLMLRSSDGSVLRRGRARKGGRSKAVTRLSYSACGTRAFTVEVRRQSGRGMFRASISARDRVGLTSARAPASWR